MKKCKRCQASKPEAEFPRNKKMSDGYHYYCKDCCNAAGRVRYEQTNKLKLGLSNFKDMPKTCKCCKEEKQNKDFGSSSSSTGLQANCRECENLKKRARNYNIKVETLKSMLSNGCEVCGSMERLAIDHDHKCCEYTRSGKSSCGKCIRGILCERCNIAEGCLTSETQAIQLIKYMKKHNAF